MIKYINTDTDSDHTYNQNGYIISKDNKKKMKKKEMKKLLTLKCDK